jgi:hypothetical protein
MVSSDPDYPELLLVVIYHHRLVYLHDPRRIPGTLCLSTVHNLRQFYGHLNENEKSTNSGNFAMEGGGG